MEKPKDTKLMFIKFAKVITILVYTYFIVASVFLIVGFFLLLFGANPNTPFVKFVYHFASLFLQPFREIFPGHQISDRSYFSGAALFAIIMYGIGALAIHSLITYVTYKQASYQAKLIKLQEAKTITDEDDEGYESSDYPRKRQPIPEVNYRRPAPKPRQKIS